MEKIDPDAVELPGWYRPNPSYARDVAFVVFNAVGGGELVPKQITNYRWSLSAFGTASAAALSRNDTVYCLTPLHNQAGLLVSLGGSVVAGSSPSAGLLRVQDPESGELFWADSSDVRLQADYKKWFRDQRQMIKEMFARSGTQFESMSTTDNYVSMLMQLFRKREVKR
jgi:hypothetical protein